ncbi:metallophosphoesterase [Candidatus Woesearchaeota archaeon]|nr:metallophosphoesterase [Candidatus Woesearchaeota archaeon]
MNRITQMIIFVIFFLIIYTILNSYIILRFGGLFRISPNILYALIAIAVISLPLSMFVENRLPNIITKAWYTVSTLWMGVGLFILTCLVIYEILSRFVSIDPFRAGIAILAIVALVSFYSVFNAFSVEVREMEVPVEGLKKEVSIVQLSDLHVGTIRNSGFLEKISRRVNDIDPDIVMITGDLVDGTAPLKPEMFKGFDDLRAPVYFVTGNHEMYEGMDKVCAFFNDTKIQVLRNEVVGWDGIQVVGVDFSEDRKHLKRVLSGLKINQSKPAVLMYHPPFSMEDAKNAGIDLQLSGHTHNGQIYPFNFFVWLALRKTTGLYDYGDMKLYVSPGTGTWGPYMRLGSRNEITVIRLVNA